MRLFIKRDRLISTALHEFFIGELVGGAVDFLIIRVRDENTNLDPHSQLDD